MQILQQLKSRLSSHDKLLAMGTSVAFVGVALHLLSGLLLVTFKTRVLGTDGYGLIFLASSIAITSFFLATSLSVTIIRYGSMFSSQESAAQLKSVVISIYKLAVPVVGVVLLLLNLAAPFIVMRFYPDKAGLQPLIHLMSLSAFFQSLSAINVGLCKIKYLVKYEYIAFISQSLLIALIAAVAMVFVQPERMLMVFAIAYPVAAFIVFLYTCTVVKKHFGFLLDRSLAPVPHGKRILRFTLYTSITATLSKSRDEINTFLIGFFLLSSDVGLYGGAFKIAFLPLILTPAVNAIFTPMVGNFYGKGDLASIKRLQLKVSIIVTIFSLAAILFYLVAGSHLLAILGEEFVEARPILLILAAGNVATAIAGPTGFAISMMGRPQYNTFNAAVLLLMMAGLCYYLVPIKGISGAAFAYAISNGFICLLCLLEMAWIYRAESRKAVAAGSVSA